MKLRNKFTDQTRALFIDSQYQCFLCRGNQGVEAHHIMGRLSASPLNLAPVCHKCHSTLGHSDKEESKLLQKTLRYLLARHYKPTKEDWEFIHLNKRLYDI